MKVYKTNEQVESIQVRYTDGTICAIWLPRQVSMKLGTLEYDEENDQDFQCEIELTCEADFENINLTREE